MPYTRISVRPLTGALGAEVGGVDVAGAIDDSTFAEIRRALLEHLVIFFRDQRLDPATLVAFARRFAPPCLAPMSKPIAEHPLVTRIVREAHVPSSVRNIGDRWHTDQTPREQPAFGFGLYCVECPPHGGDTLFTNLYLAYESLSPGMQALCDRLVLMHSASGLYGHDGRGGGGTKKSLYDQKGADFRVDPDIIRSLAVETPHPLVRVHPETGRKLLFVPGDYAIRFRDMTDAESAPLIDFLNRHAVRPEFTCRFRWTPGALAILDNRCTQHYAVNDYHGHRREMLRVELEGDRPYGPAMPRAASAAT